MDDNSHLAEQMPQTIGRYKIQEGIGWGAMGAVYKAFDPLIKRTLAIKTIRLDIPRQSPQYKSFIERFYHEARISGTLSHPNIVTLFDIGEEAGQPYLAMEYVEGQTIASILERGVRFKPEKVIGLASQIASAIDYAHGKGVIHRDIKPANLILFEEERIKVTDFGIAKLVDKEMTQQGTLLGTPSYMSPEQAMGEKLDGRSDIFSLGVCCFEMLSGEQPFPGNNVTSILYKLVHVDPIEPANLEMNGLVPQKWHEVFGKVLAKKPDDRYQTAGAFVQDLEYCLGSWFGSLGAGPTIAEPPPTAPVERTATMPRLAVPDLNAVASRAAPAAEDAPETVVMKAAAPPSAKTPPKVPPKAAPKAPPKAAAAGDSPETVLLKASPAAAEDTDSSTVSLKAPKPPAARAAKAEADTSDSSTIVLKAPPAPPRPAKAVDVSDDRSTVVLKAPSAPPATPPVETAESESTVLMEVLEEGPFPAPEAEATYVMAAPDVTLKGPVPQPEPTARMPTPPETKPLPRPTAPPLPAAPGRAPAPEVKGGPPAPRRGLPTGLVLGGAAAVFVLAVIAAGVIVWQKIRPESDAGTSPPPPSMIAENTPTTPTATPASVLGLLHVESQPAGAAVLVNGEAKGTAPLDLRDLPLGSYEVKLELKGFETRSQSVSLTAAVPRAEVSLALQRAGPAMGVADILSTPFGATVTVDGTRVGQTPLTDLKTRVGSHKVDLSKEGYGPWSGTLTVSAGKRGKLDAQLKPLPKPTPAPSPKETVDTSKIYQNTASEVDTPAKKISGLSVSYPDNAPKLKSGESVSVSLSFVVNEAGDVTDVKILSSGGKVLDEAVESAVKSWKYSPAVKHGTKLKVRVMMKQTFRAG